MALSPLACPFSIGKNCLFACNLPVSAQLQHPVEYGNTSTAASRGFGGGVGRCQAVSLRRFCSVSGGEAGKLG